MKKWELVNGSDSIRHVGGGYRIVLECSTRAAAEQSPMVLAGILARLNQEHCKCGRKCDVSGFCDDCFGG